VRRRIIPMHGVPFPRKQKGHHPGFE
jgi:hypothetical protein